MIDPTLSVSIKYTKGTPKSVPFARMRDKILGEKYDLSIVSVDTKTARKLNRETRGKDYATNILSFPLTKKSGEIVLHIPTIMKDAKKFSMTKEDFFVYIVIHGMLHLKGMQHGSTMDKEERKFARMFKVTIS